MKILLYFFISLIVLFMPIQNWGSLQKSTDDPETIEQAIARIVAEHNNDPSAHNEAGQSLFEHKQSDIIDHLASSVPLDKITGGDANIDTKFDTLDSWSKTGDANIYDHNGLGLYVEYGVTNTSRLYSAMYIPDYIFDDSSDIQFETQSIWEGTNTHIHAYFGFLNDYTDSATGFGFQIRDGVLYTYLKRSTTVEKTSKGSVDITDSHFYKAVYIESDQKVYYYVDNVLIDTLNVPSAGQWQDDRTPAFYAHLTQSNDGILYFQYLIATRKILTP